MYVIATLCGSGSFVEVLSPDLTGSNVLVVVAP